MVREINSFTPEEMDRVWSALNQKINKLNDLDSIVKDHEMSIKSINGSITTLTKEVGALCGVVHDLKNDIHKANNNGFRDFVLDVQAHLNKIEATTIAKEQKGNENIKKHSENFEKFEKRLSENEKKFAIQKGVWVFVVSSISVILAIIQIIEAIK